MSNPIRNSVLLISSVGGGAISLLGLAFIVLKLTSVIDWSWWWVTIPFWGTFAILIIGIIILAVLSK